ncbi:hypothetical protein Q5698_15535 [Brucella intermedia]|uniref:hypothetical protein n=1 Tax=Brucella intermedia TaxID=94625 RepID=UPI00163CF29F|nr:MULTISPECIES: hypothetical protein [Brucella/Ochrobactrum group]MBC2887293.1 hypothetical protein [Ochrobactrum sp. CM-21-5]WLF99123.1 hypothetical protein Q5698_15535 [Brucella intermedia]
MKKLTIRYRRRLLYWANKRSRKKNSGTAKFGYVLSADRFDQVRLPSNAIQMPKVFCLVQNTEQTLSFLEKTRQRLLAPPLSGTRSLAAHVTGKRKNKSAPRWIGPYVDFTTIEFISPAAALVLAAEYHRAVLLKEQSTKNISRLFLVDVHKWKANVIESLIEVGFFELLKITEGVQAPEEGDRKILKLRSGSRNQADEVDGLLNSIEEMFSGVGLNANDACFELNGALGEAMENAVRCAYPTEISFGRPHVSKWWMTGSLSKAQRQMTVAIYDQGVSIPGSLSSWQLYGGFLNRFLRKFGMARDSADPRFDGDVIALAIDESVTSTGLQKHGKGLGHIKAFIDSCSAGSLLIISRQGMYIYEKGKPPLTYNLPIRLSGTLIQWNVVI